MAVAASTPPPSKHPAIILILGMSVFLSLLGFLVYKTHYKSTPKSPAEFSAPSDTCAGATNAFFSPEKGITKVKVPLQTECWSGWVTTPPDWSSWEYSWTGPGGVWVQFLNGKPEWLPAGSATPVGVRRGIFRVSGQGYLFASISR